MITLGPFVQILNPITGAVTARVQARRCVCGDVLLGEVAAKWRCPTCAKLRAELKPLAKASSNTNTAVPLEKTA